MTMTSAEKTRTDRQVTVAEAVQPFKDWMQAINRSPKTIFNHNASITAWLTAMDLDDTPLPAVSPRDIEECINDPTSSSRAHSRKMVLAAPRAFFGFCCARGWVDVDPTTAVKVDETGSEPDRPRTKPKPFTKLEINRLLDDCIKREDIFWQFAITLASDTGLRLADICNLEWDCFTKHGVMQVRIGNIDKRLAIGKAVDDVLTEIPVDDPKYLFPEERATMVEPSKRALFSVQFKRMCERLDIHGKTFETLRRF
jgi:integrase